MPITPIQEKAISNIQIIASNVNFKFVTFSYTEYYNFNIDDNTYSGSNYVQIVLPYGTVNSTLNIDKDNGDTPLSWSWILKNNENTILVWDSNLWYVDQGSAFQIANLQGFHDAIINLPLG